MARRLPLTFRFVALPCRDKTLNAQAADASARTTRCSCSTRLPLCKDTQSWLRIESVNSSWDYNRLTIDGLFCCIARTGEFKVNYVSLLLVDFFFQDKHFHFRIMTKTTAVKSTLIIGAFVIIAVLLLVLVRGMGTLGSLMSNAVDRCLYTDSYLNRRHFTIRSDDIIYETAGLVPPSSSSRRSGRGEIHQGVQTLRLLLRQYKKTSSAA